MGLSPVGGGGGGVSGGGGGTSNGTGNNGGGGGSCCNMSLKCRCKWRCLLSSGFVFFFGCFVLFGSVATLYVWFAFTPYYYARSPAESASSSAVLGCQEDNEGSWSIGVFFGDSPFSLKPIEAMHVWKDKSLAWPVANPVVTCASVSDSGFPSNFVADPFLYVQNLIEDFAVARNVNFQPFRGNSYNIKLNVSASGKTLRTKWLQLKGTCLTILLFLCIAAAIVSLTEFRKE